MNVKVPDRRRRAKKAPAKKDRARPVQISMSRSLLHRIDADPEAKDQGRSALVRRAVELYLDGKSQESLRDNFRRAYAGQGPAIEAENQDLIQSQAWPDEPWSEL